MNTEAHNPHSLAKFRSRRGMLELDFFLHGFAQDAFPSLDVHLQQAYLDMMDAEDVDLIDWLTLRSEPASADWKMIVERVRDHARLSRS